MKKLLVVSIAFLAFTASACTKDDPTPEPTPSVVTSVPTQAPESPSETPEETSAPETTQPEENEPTKALEVTPTATAEEPPATQFLKRWGKSFPTVEEASMMQAAAKTCERIKDAGDNWETDNTFINEVKSDMESVGFGEVSGATAASFAVDASQSVCSVVS